VVDRRSAHSFLLRSKKITKEDVVCRTIATDGALLRGVEIQLPATNYCKVLARGKSDASGMYAFKIWDVGYHVVATSDKAHVAKLTNVDIW
jgi:hypothetical protein